MTERALPPTTFKLCLMTTEWVAVIAELATPNPTPIQERIAPSKKTPTKKPRVTRPQQRRMRREGREWRKMKEVQTVNGRTRPRRPGRRRRQRIQSIVGEAVKSLILFHDKRKRKR